MKLQILQLDAHDDHVSTRDKMASAKAERVLLVWPPTGQILRRRLDLVLIQREAARRGLELGLLTHDPQVRDHAQRLEIPLFESIDELPEKRWEGPPSRESFESPDVEDRGSPVGLPRHQRPGSHPRPSPWIRYPALGLAVLALMSLASAIFPRATLTIEPSTRTHYGFFQYELNSAPEPSDAASGMIPARAVETAITASLRTETTGQRMVPSTRAEGRLLFTNLTPDAVEIPAGTSTRTLGEAGVRALTQEAASLPASQGAAIEVAAIAAEPGESGNLAAGEIAAVDGPLGLAVSVTNPEPFAGGTSVSEPIVAEADVRQLRQTAESEAAMRAPAQLEEAIPSSKLVDGSLRVVEVLTEDYDAQPGDLAASVGLTLTLRVQALAFSSEDLVEAIEQEVAMRPRTEGAWHPVPGTVKLGEVQTAYVGPSQAKVETQAHWDAYRPSDEVQIRRTAAGSLPKEVTALAAAFGLESMQAEWRPAWMPRLPYLPTQISVRYSWDAR